MNKFFFFLLFLFITNQLSAQSPVGIWKNLDDEDGEEKSHIEIYEENGKLKGKVIKLLPAATLTTCNACIGNKKGKSIVGMEILWDLVKKGKKYENGTILDPKSGKEYDCFIALDGNDKLKVRGYVGVSMFGRTQYWYRVK